MKRFLSFFFAVALSVSLAGCASTAHNSPSVSSSPETALPVQETNSWGITLSLKGLTRTGATIVCTQSGGTFTGELNTGSYFVLEQLTNQGWVEVPMKELEGELAWNMIAYIVTPSGTTEWPINWEWLYGELPDGHYRVGKEFMNLRSPGDYDKMMIYGEFSI
jgi:hypothetical protein